MTRFDFTGPEATQKSGTDSALPYTEFTSRLEKFVLIEVYNGKHQLAEISAADIIRRVRHHNRENLAASPGLARKGAIGELTYRDLRQVLSEGRSASVEVRRDCILLCIHPITALVFHDRCVFLVDEELAVDKLIVRLESITSTYANRVFETEKYYREEERNAVGTESLPHSAMSRMAEPPVPSPAIQVGVHGGIRESRGHDPYPRQESAHEARGSLEARGEAEATRAMEFGEVGRSRLGGRPPTLLDPLIGLVAESSERSPGGARDTKTMEEASKIPKFVAFPEEFALLEVLISHAMAHLTSMIGDMEQRAEKISKRTRVKRPTREGLAELQDLRGPLEDYYDLIGTVSKAFKDLLSNEDDMSYMDLTRLFYRPTLYSQLNPTEPNPNLEIMLEFFDQELDELLRRAKRLIREIDSAERYVQLRMALTRNKLVFYELAASLLTVGLGAGSCISGIFGMNLLSGIEDSPHIFSFFSYLILAVVIVCVFSTCWLLYRLQM